MAFGITKIGLLGSSSVSTIGNNTVYTVPAGSSARVKLMWAIETDIGGGVCSVRIQVNGVNVWGDTLTAGDDAWTGAKEGTDLWDPSNIQVHSNQLGAVRVTAAGGAQLMAPLPVVYSLDAADVVRYNIATTAPDEIYVAVSGIEFTV